MTTEEMLLQLIEGQKQMSADIANIKEDIKELKEDVKELREDVEELKEDVEELKEEATITRCVLNRHGEILEQMVKDLEPLNMLNVKYE